MILLEVLLAVLPLDNQEEGLGVAGSDLEKADQAEVNSELIITLLWFV